MFEDFLTQSKPTVYETSTHAASGTPGEASSAYAQLAADTSNFVQTGTLPPLPLDIPKPVDPNPKFKFSELDPQLAGSLVNEYGFSPAGAEGILSALRYQPTQGFGLAGWNGERATLLFQFADRHRLDPNDLKTQLSFMMLELEQHHPTLLQELQTANSPQDAASLFYAEYLNGPEWT